MGNMLTAQLTISGTRPLFWHHFGPNSIPADGKKERTGVAGNDPHEWRRTVLVTADHQLFVEPAYIFGSLRDGARHTMRKRGTLQPYVAATLQVLDDRVLVDRWLPDPLTTDPDAPVYLDVRSVKNPATRARSVRYRVATGPGWKITCRIVWDKTVVSRTEMESVAHDAGRLAGIGDGRAVGYGRYTVDSFVIHDH